MAVIPQFNRRSISLTGGVPQVADYTGVGRGLQDVAGSIEKIQDRRNAIQTQLEVIKLDRRFDELRYATEELKGSNALGVSESTINEYDSIKQEALEGIENPVVQGNINAYFDKKYGEHLTWTRKYERGQEEVSIKMVDRIWRENSDTKLESLPFVDLNAWDKQINIDVMAAATREGEGRWTSERELLYSQGRTDEVYVGQLTNWYTQNPDETYKFVEENKDKLKEKLSTEAYQAVMDMHEEKYDEAEVMRLRKQARQTHGDNYLAAAFDLKDPANYEKYGITNYKHADAAANAFISMNQINKAVSEQQRQERIDRQTEAWTDAYNTIMQMPPGDVRNANITNLRRQVEINTDLTPDQKDQFITSMTKANFRTDPSRITQIQDDIDAGNITTRAGIRAYHGDGLGTKDLNSLYSYLDNYQSNTAKGHTTNYFDDAVNTYKSRAVHPTSKIAERRIGKLKDLDESLLSRFKQRLRIRQKQEGLASNDPRIQDIAEELMSTQWYKLERGREKIFEEEPGLFTFGEKKRPAFMAPLTEEEQETQRQLIEEETQTQTPTAPTEQVNTRQQMVDAYKLYYANPDRIPGATDDAKLEYMLRALETITGRPPTEEEEIQLRSEITGGV